ncbi:Probable Cytidine deaminase EC 3545 [Bradyrhizobium sp.]|uniref:anti-phage dCTP deaminase n=1 Tax=Bradyrhizobium sp. TaxID=376 RepID=UPI0007C1DAD6|nr:anti-phage dCTP deaminase [Bradyrhizobium sp.]CUT15791.1 Probable Cytidine deaminase EC 3545 [Bradyrhizobium sp.]
MNASQGDVRALTFPELVIGIAGPIGVDLDQIASSLEKALVDVAYTSELIKLTAEMERFPISDEDELDELKRWAGPDTFNTYMRKMSQANALRKENTDPAILARIAIDAIQLRRQMHTGAADKVRSKHAYVVRQLKRPEEVALLRKVYGRQFILVSAYAPETLRREKLCERLKRELSTTATPSEIAFQADQLIERDASEDGEALGQQLRDTFHLADVFIDGLNKQEMDRKIARFICAFFGRNDITPSKDEYGMYAAKSAALRSADLSRQVGAALFSSDGELVTQGCNEVPKAFGGTYWDLEDPDHRDITRGHDPNEFHKREILREVIERLRSSSFLSPELLMLGSDSNIVEALIAKPTDEKPAGALRSARINDLTEYGRVVHAEMLAICDAARIGRSVKGTTLYCTTFPCHNCTKHVLASGVRRVVFMEPYPKSRAKDLHPDEIEIEAESETKVGFVPFMGISPFRYRDIFQKGRRKRDDGKSNDWLKGEPVPMIDFVLPSYTYSEAWALAELLGGLVEKQPGE